MQKCDFCTERWVEGKPPVCVAACPMRALDAGELEEIKRRHGNGIEAPGFEFSVVTRPSIVIKARETPDRRKPTGKPRRI
jgi:anaerobic dimethyl sulfoxide reductase subunit B (iron-sulfur subunit)